MLPAIPSKIVTLRRFRLSRGPGMRRNGRERFASARQAGDFTAILPMPISSTRRVLSIFFVLRLLLVSCRADVREISSLRQILPELTPGTLLVLDLDNTLIRPAGNLGSDQWYYFLVRKFRDRDGLSAAAAERAAMALWNRVQPSLHLQTVEPETARLIRAEQDRGFLTLGLTARTTDIAATTIAQLRGVGVNLARHTVPTHHFTWPTADPVLFKGGVLFVGEGNEKGRTLLEFLRRAGVRPARIVFVDDKRRHTVSVDRAARVAGVPCVAFRYGATDRRVEEFNADTHNLDLFLGKPSRRTPASSTKP
jgi:phosphoglycolate phosphatase-like HAD superfamily hydrolase